MKAANEKYRINRNMLKNPIFIAGFAALSYWLFQFHWDRMLAIMPYSILLLCPLMHVFMQRRHKHGQNHRSQDGGPIEDKRSG